MSASDTSSDTTPEVAIQNFNQSNDAQPIAESERVETLDVLRGFALFGIMFVNVYAFVNPVEWFKVDWASLNSLEYGAEIFKILFTQGKFYSLFAILFGLGFAVQLASAEKKGNKFALRFFWRILLLWVIGVIHAIVIWNGDILNTYAVAGLILLFCYGFKRLLDMGFAKFSSKRDKAPRGLALILSALLLLGPYVGFGLKVYSDGQTLKAHEAGQILTAEQQKFIEQREKNRSPEKIAERAERKAKDLAVYEDGSYFDMVEMRFKDAPRKLISGPFWLTVCGLFLIGAFIGRNNYIGRAQEYQQGFKRLAIGGFVVGMAFNVGFVYAHITWPQNPDQSWFWLMYFSKTVAGLALALMFVGIITLAMLGRAKSYLSYFAPVGRMALTNYLTQSIIGSFIFYGYGLGMLGSLSVFQQFAYIVVLFTAQVWFSRWWLNHYRFGPVEWLWRSLTYFKAQPMKRRDSKLLNGQPA